MFVYNSRKYRGRSIKILEKETNTFEVVLRDSVIRGAKDIGIKPLGDYIPPEDENPEVDRLYKIGSTVYKLKYILGDRGLDIFQYYEGQKSLYKSLEESDCKELGIEFEKDLFPRPLVDHLKEWKKGTTEFTESDLSTYPVKDDTLDYMVLRIGGFENTKNPDIIKLPDNYFLSAEQFLTSLRIKFRTKIIPFNGSVRKQEGDLISWAPILTPFKGSEKVVGDLVDRDGNIYLLLDLRGISIFSLIDMSASEVFSITWDESFSNNPKNLETESVIGSINDWELDEYDSVLFEKGSFDLYWKIK